MGSVTKTYNPTIVKMQTVGILFVVVGHMFPELRNSREMPLVPQVIYTWIFSFHMYFFMFISGVLFFWTNSRRRFSYLATVVGKVRRLLLPFVVLSSVAFIPKCALSGFAYRGLELTHITFFKMFYIPAYNPVVYFWFLQALFLIFLTSFSLLYFSKKNILILALVSIVLFLLPFLINFNEDIFSVNKAIKFIFYFWAGMIAARYRSNGKFCGNPSVIFLAVIVTWGVVYIRYTFDVPQKYSLLLEPIASFSGIVMCIGIAHRWATVKKDPFTYIDGFSYQIYLLSWFFSVFFRIPYQMGIYNFYIASFLRLFAALFFPVIIARIAVKYKTFLNPAIGL